MPYTIYHMAQAQDVNVESILSSWVKSYLAHSLRTEPPPFHVFLSGEEKQTALLIPANSGFPYYPTPANRSSSFSHSRPY